MKNIKIEFRHGFTVYKSSNKEPCFVAPHCGPAFETTTSRDVNSETVASLCWMKMGGTMLISNVSRKRAMGIDLNRAVPPKPESLNCFSDFMLDRNPAKLYGYRKKYAWSAASNEDHENRNRIYHDFWDEVKRHSFIIIVHTAFTRLKAVPSLMDLVSFDSKIMDKKTLSDVIEEVNKENLHFLRRIERDYKNAVMAEQERAVVNMLRIYEQFGLDRLKGEFLENLKKDVAAIRKYLGEKAYAHLQRDFSANHFLEKCRFALEKAEYPRITMEHIFKGTGSYAPRRELSTRKRIVIQFEPVSFMNIWYPQETSDMIVSIINKILERTSR